MKRTLTLRYVDNLLDGNLPAYASAALRRRESHRHPLARDRERSTKDQPIFPEFRRALRDWFCGRRYQPWLMSKLAALVKPPIDRHRGDPDTDGGRYPSCVVVGNSGILLQCKHGALIDGHEMVTLLNNAHVEGYQRFVGSKTDLSFVNSNIFLICAHREGCFCHPYGEAVPIIVYIWLKPVNA